ncbi:MAG: TlpA disulfide reductase family protein [Saprospiraceae bacterium]
MLFTGVYGQKTITVEAKTKGCTQDLSLYTFDGTTFKPVYTASAVGDTFTFKLPAEGHHFYYFGPDATHLKPWILGGESGVVLQESCTGALPSMVLNSPINDQYTALKNEFAQLNQRSQEAVNLYRLGVRSEEKKQQGIAMMADVDKQRMQLLDSLRKANPFLGRVAAFNTYLSFFNHGTEKYQDELSYFINEFFRFVDWKDEQYHNSPWVYESFKSYTTTLSSVFADAAPFIAAVDAALAPLPEGGIAEKLALGGIIAHLSQKKHPAFAHYANRFVNHFKAQDPQAAADLAQQVKAQASFTVGGEAPDFSQNDPDGNPIQLSSLRGKLLLVDFWASWCGPCRRENPNVKRVYEAYKDKGFEILGVSLDSSRERWLGAIEQDGLPWLHVSDLKGWQNAVAKLYSVSSIPHTVLLDAEGRILARGLRGEQLEQKVAEILGAN